MPCLVQFPCVGLGPYFPLSVDRPVRDPLTLFIGDEPRLGPPSLILLRFPTTHCLLRLENVTRCIPVYSTAPPSLLSDKIEDQSIVSPPIIRSIIPHRHCSVRSTTMHLYVFRPESAPLSSARVLMADYQKRKYRGKNLAIRSSAGWAPILNFQKRK